MSSRRSHQRHRYYPSISAVFDGQDPGLEPWNKGLPASSRRTFYGNYLTVPGQSAGMTPASSRMLSTVSSTISTASFSAVSLDDTGEDEICVFIPEYSPHSSISARTHPHRESYVLHRRVDRPMIRTATYQFSPSPTLPTFITSYPSPPSSEMAPNGNMSTKKPVSLVKKLKRIIKPIAFGLKKRENAKRDATVDTTMTQKIALRQLHNIPKILVCPPDCTSQSHKTQGPQELALLKKPLTRKAGHSDHARRASHWSHAVTYQLLGMRTPDVNGAVPVTSVRRI